MKGRIRKVLGGLVGLVALSVLLGTWDYIRVKNLKRPLFTFKSEYYSDGGTMSFLGFGYKIIYWHQMRVNEYEDSIYVGTEFLWGPKLLFPSWVAPIENLQRYDSRDPNIPHLLTEFE